MTFSSSEIISVIGFGCMVAIAVIGFKNFGGSSSKGNDNGSSGNASSSSVSSTNNVENNSK